MKIYLAFLMIAASALGQPPCLHGNIKVSGVKLINCLPPKPHKRKPSAKPIAGLDHQSEKITVADPCDGLSCTGPIEMLPKENVKTKLPDKFNSYAIDICQTAGQKNCVNVMCEGPNLVEGCPNFPNAEYHDFLDKTGYHANFTDPQGKWRCEVTGTVVANGWGGTTAFILACAKPHEVQSEGKTK